jgi:hypothetical protein
MSGEHDTMILTGQYQISRSDQAFLSHCSLLANKKFTKVVQSFVVACKRWRFDDQLRSDAMGGSIELSPKTALAVTLRSMSGCSIIWRRSWASAIRLPKIATL